jgi:hypothetical protein
VHADDMMGFALQNHGPPLQQTGLSKSSGSVHFSEKPNEFYQASLDKNSTMGRP